MEQLFKKPLIKRVIYSGWDNYSEAELDIIKKVKDVLKEKHDIDLTKIKGFGPRSADGACVQGTMKIESGKDALLTDEILLRYCIARKMSVEKILPDLLYHLEWR